MQSAVNPVRLKWLYATGLLVVLIASLYSSYRAIGQQAIADLAAESQNSLTLFVSHLSAALDKYEHLPELISTNYRFINIVGQPDAATIDDANRYLQSVAQTSGASDVYLMAKDGTTLASSNWEMEHTFIGRNFGFRPYFKQAMEGRRGRYFALGTMSNLRGYYFSYPVYLAGSVAGVLVVKINLADIETAWADRGNHFVVTDEDGIVFLSTQPQWIYHSLKPLNSQRMLQIQQSQRYQGKSLTALKLRSLGETEPGINLVSIGEDAQAAPRYFLHLSQSIATAGWNAHLFADTRSLKDIQILRTALAGLAMLILLLLIVLYLTNRQRRLALQGSTELLEQRVRQRTRELQNEVEERARTEQSLRDTQSELIQAAKLAGLGQMSAGISHELNQPLTAIRNYSENAKRFLSRNDIDAAACNLTEIDEITEVMAGIISQLRGFSRKSRGELSRISLDQAVSQALALFEREIKTASIEVAIDIDSELSLITDPLLFNQVLVNLISNAIHAMASRPGPRIIISAGFADGDILLEISDTGSGISETVIDNVFDPFFTTKEVGLGLGLGLSICYRIMESLGGRIEASNIAAGGARFRLYLPNE